MKILMKYILTIIALAALAVIAVIQKDTAVKAVSITASSALTMLKILPPVLVIMNLLDALIPKESVMKHMGGDAGLKGYFWALVLGTFAAGPLYAAFPIAALLSKKEARLSCIIFFLGMWTVTKLPLLTYEVEYFGPEFTGVHILTGIVFYFLLSLMLEKTVLKNDKREIQDRLAKM